MGRSNIEQHLQAMSSEPDQAAHGSPLRDLFVPPISAAAAAHRLVATSDVKAQVAASLTAEAGRRGWPAETFYLAAWVLIQHQWRGARHVAIGFADKAGE